jgi:hypothetical protein
LTTCKSLVSLWTFIFGGVALFCIHINELSRHFFSPRALLTIICNVSSLLPLLFINWLDDAGDVSVAEIESTDGK